MISPELIRRSPFFAGLKHEHIVALAYAAEEKSVEAGHYFFHEGSDLDYVYLLCEGEVAIVIEVPDHSVEQKVSGQLTGKLQTKDVVTSSVGPGEIFAWSALVPPYQATASAKAAKPCRLIVFDAAALRRAFDDDCRFGYLMIQKAAQVSSNRLRDMRIESLAFLVETE